MDQIPVILGGVLPVTLSVSQEMLHLISSIDEFKGEWRLIRELSPERLSQLRRVATVVGNMHCKYARPRFE